MLESDLVITTITLVEWLSGGYDVGRWLEDFPWSTPDLWL